MGQILDHCQANFQAIYDPNSEKMSQENEHEDHIWARIQGPYAVLTVDELSQISHLSQN